LLKHIKNSGGPSGSRNTAISISQTPYVFMLDADNFLYSRCVSRCLETIENSDAAFVYPLIEKFGAEVGIIGNQVWNPDTLAYGPYIDNTSLIRKTCLEEVGGYTHLLYGWEDFDLWCKFVEQNYYGILIPEILARYRVHQCDMRVSSKVDQNFQSLIFDIKKRHPWLKFTG
jgi:glycosyltransferase involved in cell wall biosynthesis